MYALFKLKLVRGKTIIFVNSVDKCYRIKLYLEQFGIPVCVLNSELPNSTRCHIVTQFNKGIYEVIKKIVAVYEVRCFDDDYSFIRSLSRQMKNSSTKGRMGQGTRKRVTRTKPILKGRKTRRVASREE